MAINTLVPPQWAPNALVTPLFVRMRRVCQTMCVLVPIHSQDEEKSTNALYKFDERFWNLYSQIEF